jgi:hypothetical protein
MTFAIPAADASTFAVPQAPAGSSPAMVEVFDRYMTQFIREDDERAWDAAAHAVADFQPVTAADVAAKLLVIGHYMQPEMVNGVPVIDLSAFDCATGHMLLRCVADLQLMAEAGK